MNETATTVLCQMVKMFNQKHRRPPCQIVVTPLALLALALKNSAPSNFGGVPVVCREIAEGEATDKSYEAKSLAIFVLPEDRTGRIVSCDLKT
jgi:hypothetical protein